MSCEHSLRFFQWISPFLTRKKTSHPHTFAHNKAPRSPKAHIRSIKIMYAEQSTAKHGTSVQRFYMYIHMLHSHASLVFTPSPIESDLKWLRSNWSRIRKWTNSTSSSSTRSTLEFEEWRTELNALRNALTNCRTVAAPAPASGLSLLPQQLLWWPPSRHETLWAFERRVKCCKLIQKTRSK